MMKSIVRQIFFIFFSLKAGLTLNLPRFIQQPKSEVIRPGSSVTLHCEVLPAPTRVRWLFNNLPYSPANMAASKKEILKLTSFGQTPASQEGGYRCVAVTSAGTIVSQEARLDLAVLGPHNTSSSNLKLYSPPSSTVFIPCQPPFSKPSAILEFEFNNSRLALTDRHEILPSSHLRINHLNANDSGTYRCLAFNPLLMNRLRSNVTTRLTVTDGAINTSLWTPFPSLTTVQGKNVTIECATSWSDDANITWEKYGGHLTRYHIKNGNLMLHSVQKFDSGTYICKVNSPTNEALNRVISLIVLEPPVIEPVPQELHVVEGSAVTFKCKPPSLAGTTKYSVHWFHNGALLLPNNSIDIKDYSLSILNINHRYSGIYQCFVKNLAGSASVISRLTVLQRTINGKIASSSDINDDEDMGDDDETDDDEYGSGDGDAEGKTDDSNIRLKVSVQSEMSVLVSWSMQNVLSGQVSNLRLQVKDLDEETGWVSIDDHVGIKTKSVHVPNLLPGRTYKFRLTAFGANRLALMSSGSVKVTMPLPPLDRGGFVAPKLQASSIAIVEARAIGCTEMYIGWQVNDQEAYSAEAYEISYSPYENTFDAMTSVVPGSAVRNAVIRGLRPNSAYSFKARGLYETEGTTVKGLYSGDVVENTNECDSEMADDLDAKSGMKANELWPLSDETKRRNESIVYIVVGAVLSLLLVGGIIALAACFYHRRVLNKKTGDKALKNSVDPSAYTLRTCVGEGSQGGVAPHYPFHADGEGMDRASAISSGIIRNGTYLRLPNGEMCKEGLREDGVRGSRGSGEMRLPMSEQHTFYDSNFDSNLYDTVEQILPGHATISQFPESGGPSSTTSWSNYMPNFNQISERGQNYPIHSSYRPSEVKKYTPPPHLMSASATHEENHFTSNLPRYHSNHNSSNRYPRSLPVAMEISQCPPNIFEAEKYQLQR